jgi:branched-chain amino acid transport system substrate-binding protein
MRGKSNINRRKFIQTAALAAGVSTISPIIPAVLSPTDPQSVRDSSTLKIGILLPPSRIYPDMAKQWLNGFNLHLNQYENKITGKKIDRLIQRIGFGPNSAYQKSRELLRDSGVHIYAGIIGSAACAQIRNLFEEKHTFLIANHVGANIIPACDHSPYIIHNSLNYWQANWNLGEWAAKNLGKKALQTSSFYESGYDAVYAFQHGFESAGGQIVRSLVQHVPTETQDQTPLILNTIREEMPDLVFASYSGSAAAEFVHAYYHSGLSSQVPLLGSGFLADESLDSGYSKQAAGIRTCMPWSPDLNLADNVNFQRTFKRNTGCRASVFAVMGYETARLIERVMILNERYTSNSEKIRMALSEIRFMSPRGNLEIEKQTSTVKSPLYLREARPAGSEIRHTILAELKGSLTKDSQLPLMNTSVKTGWLNPYLCI